ncbi:MAG: diguanylate cyclase [Lachnospiraceae bacterium]|nr:diguanylate cyclase [Lachnospiraceae bacterium]
MASGNIILIVDDAEVNREMMAEVFGDDYIILQAENGVQAMKILRGHRKALAAVLLDIVMPRMNGYEVLSEMKNQNLLFEIPVIVVTGMVDEAERDVLLRKGASEVLFKPVSPKKLRDSVSKVIESKNYRNKLENNVKINESPQVAKGQDTMDAVMSIMKHPNMENPLHMLRVSAYTRAFLNAYKKIDKKAKLTDEKINYMSEAALIHDVGKLVISPQILNKKGPMTEEEMSVMKSHCIQGCNIISIFDQSDKNEFIKYTYNICKFHHEHWDGTGYPTGVSGDSIPICAQAVALTTELDFLTAGGREFTDNNIEGILTGKGSKYKEEVIEAFEASLEEMKEEKDKINAIDTSDAYDIVTNRLIDIFDIKDVADAKAGAEKYNSLLSLLDATVFEVDIVTGRFRRIYTTFSDFTDIPQRGNLTEDFMDVINMDIKDEFRNETLAFLYNAVSGKKKSTTIPESVTCQIYSTFHNAYQWYRISAIGMIPSPTTNNRIMLVIKNVDSEIYVQSEINKMVTKTKRIERDIKKYKDENEKLKASAQYDKLTDLYNKNAAAMAIEELLREYPDGIHGMMLINIDNFKSINERYGHMEGDNALKRFAILINRQFRNCDIVGRRKGDEFIVFMTNLPSFDVLTIKAENIVASIGKLSRESKVYENITVSIGISFYPGHGDSYARLYQKSDAALAAARKNGRNRYKVFDENTKIVKKITEVIDRAGWNRRQFDFLTSLYNIRFSSDVSIDGISNLVDAIGREYNLNDIFIVDYDSTDIVFKWTAGSVIDSTYITGEDLREFLDIIRINNDDVEWVVDDVKILGEELKKMLLDNKVGSFVCEPIMRGSRAAGMVLFIKEHEQVEFSADMLEAFRIATKLVRDHILRVKSEKDNKFLRGILGEVIDIPGIKTHVIDDSYRLLKKGEEGEMLTWGKKCYEELFGLKKPCKDCLIKHISRENERIEDAKTSATMISVGRFNRVYVVMEKEQETKSKK